MNSKHNFQSFAQVIKANKGLSQIIGNMFAQIKWDLIYNKHHLTIN